MELTFSRGRFILNNPEYQWKDQVKGVPGSKWDSEKKAWIYPSLLETKQTLLILYQNGLIDADEKALKQLSEVEEYADRLETVKSIKEEQRVEIDVPLKVELFQHQKRAYKIGITIPNVGLLMEQGTGKTLTSLAIAGHRHINREVNKLLIVAPLSTIHGWKEEIKNHVNFPVEIYDLTSVKKKKRDQMLHNMINTKARTPSPPLYIALINHQSAWRIYPELDDWDADMIIIDESQKIKSGRAKQSKALHKLGDQARYKAILSGTPVTQGPLDVWSQYRFLDVNIFGRFYGKFKNEYAVMGGFKNYKVVGFRNLEKLAKKAHSIAYRVRKEDTEIDLPPVVDQFLYTSIGKKAKAYYKEMEKDFKVTLEDNEGDVKAPIVLTKLLRLQQIAGGFLQTEPEEGVKETVQVDNAKLNLLKELVEDMPTNKKMVIFARFIPEVDAIKEELEALGRKVVTLTGGTPDRGAVIDQFTNDEETTIFVAQIQTGGVGINLQVADTAIFYSTNFSYGDYDQAKARVHRIGQKSDSVTYIHLLAENTVDEDIIAALKAKKDVADHLIDELK